MACPKCGSVNIKLVSEPQLKAKHHGCLWWCFVGWWWSPIKSIVYTIPMYIANKIVPDDKSKAETNKKDMWQWECQDCKNYWVSSEVINKSYIPTKIEVEPNQNNKVPYGPGAKNVKTNNKTKDDDLVAVKVAGVSFKNDDGTSRQSILRKIKFSDPPFDDEVEIELRRGTYENKLAIYVYANGQQIGSVPKEQINKIDKIMDDILNIEAEVYGGGKSSDGTQKSFGCELLINI